MPYIPKGNREKFDRYIDILVHSIHGTGDLNYIITKLCHMEVEHHGISYGVVRTIMGDLNCVANEFYRTVVAPFEEKKRLENGDI